MKKIQHFERPLNLHMTVLTFERTKVVYYPTGTSGAIALSSVHVAYGSVDL